MQLQKKLNYFQDIYQEIQDIKFQIKFKPTHDTIYYESQLKNILNRVQNTDINSVILPEDWCADGQSYNKSQFFTLVKQELFTQIDEATYHISFNQKFTGISQECEKYLQRINSILKQNDQSLIDECDNYYDLNQQFQRELESTYKQFKLVSSSFCFIKSNDPQFSKIQGQLQTVELKFDIAKERLIQNLKDNFPTISFDRQPQLMTIDQYLQLLDRESFETSSSDDKSNNETPNEPVPTVEHKSSIRSQYFLGRRDSRLGSGQGSILFSARSSKSRRESRAISTQRGSDSLGRTRTFSFSGMIKTFNSYRTQDFDALESNINSSRNIQEEMQEPPVPVRRKSNIFQTKPILEKTRFVEHSSSDSENEEDVETQQRALKRNAFVTRPSVFYPLQQIEEERDDDNLSLNAADDLLSSNMFVNQQSIKRNTRRSSILSDVGSRSSKIDNEIILRPQLSKRHSQFINSKEALQRKKKSHDTPDISDRDSDITDNDLKKKRSSGSSDEAPDILKDRDAFSNNLPLNQGSRFEKKNSFISSAFNDTTNIHQTQRLSQTSLASSQLMDLTKDRKSFLILASQIAYRAKMSVVLNDDLLPTPKTSGQAPFNHQIFLLSQESFFLKTRYNKPKPRGSQLLQKLSKSTNFGLESMVDFSDSQDEIDELSEQLAHTEKEVYKAQQEIFQILQANISQIIIFLSKEISNSQMSFTFSEWVINSLKIDYSAFVGAFMQLHAKERASQIILLKINIKQEDQDQSQLKQFINHSSHLITKECLGQIKIMKQIQVITDNFVNFIHKWLKQHKISDAYKDPDHIANIAQRIIILQQQICKSQKSGYLDLIGENEPQAINIEPFDVDVNSSAEMKQIYKEITKISQGNTKISKQLSEWTLDIIQTLQLLVEFCEVYVNYLRIEREGKFNSHQDSIFEDLGIQQKKINEIIHHRKISLPRLNAVQSLLTDAIKQQIPHFNLRNR